MTYTPARRGPDGTGSAFLTVIVFLIGIWLGSIMARSNQMISPGLLLTVVGTMALLWLASRAGGAVTVAAWHRHQEGEKWFRSVLLNLNFGWSMHVLAGGAATILMVGLPRTTTVTQDEANMMGVFILFAFVVGLVLELLAAAIFNETLANNSLQPTPRSARGA